MNMILQAWALAPSVDRFSARAQRKDEPHQVDQLAQTMSVGIGAEVSRAVVSHHSREDHPRKRLVGHLQVWVAFVVAKTDVEGGLMALDQIRFENQRFDFVGNDDRSNVDDSLRHRRDPNVMHGALLKIRTHAISQRDRFADVQDLVAGADHHVDAWSIRDLRKIGEQRHLARRVATAPA